MSKKRIFSVLAVIFFLIALTLSLDFLVVEAEHECCGEGCRICAVLQVADNICGGDKKTESNQISTVSSFRPVKAVLFSESGCDKKTESPVSRCDILTI